MAVHSSIVLLCVDCLTGSLPVLLLPSYSLLWLLYSGVDSDCLQCDYVVQYYCAMISCLSVCFSIFPKWLLLILYIYEVLYSIWLLGERQKRRHFGSPYLTPPVGKPLNDVCVLGISTYFHWGKNIIPVVDVLVPIVDLLIWWYLRRQWLVPFDSVWKFILLLLVICC